MYIELKTIEDFNEATKNNKIALFYFSHQKCSVCQVLKPKIEVLIKSKFPKVQLFYVDTQVSLEISAQNSIFTNPAVLIHIFGKEHFRKARNMGLQELSHVLGKPYSMIFN